MMTREQAVIQAPRGWRPLVGKLYDDLIALGWDGEVLQVKEKFGGLRFYVGEASDAVHDRIEVAEITSEKICQVCGEPGDVVGVDSIRGWP